MVRALASQESSAHNHQARKSRRQCTQKREGSVDGTRKKRAKTLPLCALAEGGGGSLDSAHKKSSEASAHTEF